MTDPTPPRICFILEHFYPHIGGSEVVTLEYASRLVRLGFDVRVATSNSGGVTGSRELHGFQVHYHPWPSFFGHPLPRRRDLLEHARWADIIHTATYSAAPAASRIARTAQKPCVITAFEVLGPRWSWVEGNRLKAFLFRTFENYVIRKPYSLYHTISQASRLDLERAGIPPHQIVMIYPGLHDKYKGTAASPGPAGDGNKTFLYYGRPGKTKGIFVFLEAINHLARTQPPEALGGAEFTLIMSDDPLREKLKAKQYVARQGLQDRVRILDTLPFEALAKKIQSAYCVVIPSITEGFGFTAVEACAFGKPIIVSRAGSLPEVVSGRVLFFENRNSIDLAGKIMLALGDRFETVAPRVFSWDASVNELADAYGRLVPRLEAGRDLSKQSGDIH